MSVATVLTLDGKEVAGRAGETMRVAADEAGVWIPRLCAMKGLKPWGGCRVCTVKTNGRFGAACTTPISLGLAVENDTEELTALRRDLIDMLFVEGNHYCMFCEKSGACELQALAYRFGILAPSFPYLFPDREVDLSHPDVMLDRNRCVLCARCVRSSRQIDGKHELGFAGRGPDKRIAADSDGPLEDTRIAADDAAVAACPTGALLRKGVGFAVPVGERAYDGRPIGSEIESDHGSEGR